MKATIFATALVTTTLAIKNKSKLLNAVSTDPLDCMAQAGIIEHAIYGRQNKGGDSVTTDLFNYWYGAYYDKEHDQYYDCLRDKLYDHKDGSLKFWNWENNDWHLLYVIKPHRMDKDRAEYTYSGHLKGEYAYYDPFYMEKQWDNGRIHWWKKIDGDWELRKWMPN